MEFILQSRKERNADSSRNRVIIDTSGEAFTRWSKNGMEIVIFDWDKPRVFNLNDWTMEVYA